MKILVAFLCALVASVEGSAQYTQTITPLLDTQAGVMKELPPRIGAVKGSVYLNEQWTESDLYLTPGVYSVDTIENVPVRLDLETYVLELLTDAGVKVLEPAKIDRFEFTDSGTGRRDLYVNCNRFTLDGSALVGFCKVSGDEVKLVRRDYLEVLKPNYNVALDVGSRENQIIKKHKLYFSKNGVLRESNKRSLYTLMADHEVAIKQFVKDRHLKTAEEDDLRTIVDYYNSLLK